MAVILTKKSDTASSVPTSGALTNSSGGAEIAVNTADKRLFTKDSGGTVVELGTNPSSLTLPNGTANGLAFLNASKVLTSGSALTFDGSKLTVSATSGETGLLTATGTSNYLSVKGDTAGTTLWAGFGTDIGLTWIGAVSNHPVSFRQNNAEQMRLTSTGLGIGTSSPSYKLDVNTTGGAVATARLYGNDQANVRLRLQNAGAGGRTWEIVGGYPGANNANFSILDVTGSTVPLTIDSSGNLGLGVTPSAWISAYKALDIGTMTSIYGRTDTTAEFALSLNGYRASSGSWLYKTDNAASRYGQAYGAHVWATAASGTAGNTISFTDVMTLDASGRLGIGTTSPFGVLHATDGTSRIIIGTGGGSSGYNIYSSGGYQAFETNGQERARIDSSGNFGIGTTSPGAKLEVANSNILLSNAYYLSSRNAANTTTISMIGRNTSDQVVIDADGYGLKMGVGGALFLNGSGNLGLGVTPSAWGTSFKAMQIGTGGAVWGSTSATEVNIGANTRVDIGNAQYDYINNGVATQYQQASGLHKWFVAGSGTAGSAISFTQAMTLDASGNLGVGSTSPTGKLDIRSSGLSGTDKVIFQITDTANTTFQINQTTSYSQIMANNALTFSNGITERARIDSSGNLLINATSGSGINERLNVTGNGIVTQSSASTNRALIGTFGGSDFIVGTYDSFPLVFRTGNNERARIDSSGNLLVGTTSNTRSVRLRVDGNEPAQFTGYGSGYGIGLWMTPNASSSGGNATPISFQNVSGNTVGTITTTSSATAYNTSSDYRLKNTIAPMTGALAKVQQLKPCTYKWNVDGSDGEGFIAHELAEVCPQAVTGEKDAVDADGNPVYQGIDTSFLAGLYAAAIQELKAEVDSLKSEINTLKGI